MTVYDEKGNKTHFSDFAWSKLPERIKAKYTTGNGEQPEMDVSVKTIKTVNAPEVIKKKLEDVAPAENVDDITGNPIIEHSGVKQEIEPTKPVKVKKARKPRKHASTK